MTLATPSDIRMIPSNAPIFPFWAGSALLHVGIVVLFSLLHFTNELEPTRPVVQVTLVEATTPSSDPTPATPKHREPPTTPPPKKAQQLVTSTPQMPVLMKAQRPVPPGHQQLVSIPQPLPTPIIRTTLAKIPVPLKPVEIVQPKHRRTLRDHKATNNLNLKNFLKVAQRTPASRTTTPQVTPQIDMLSSSRALPPSLSTRTSTVSDSPVRRINTRTLTPNVLKAMAPGSGRISKSKVGLGRTIPPVYPRIARESGWEGTVLVRVAVQPDGRPDSIKVRKSSGHQILDEAAVEAVKKWRFFPAKDGNIPIRSMVEIPINFDLRKQG